MNALSPALKHQRALANLNALSQGAGRARVLIYSAPRPPDGDPPGSAVLLVNAQLQLVPASVINNITTLLFDGIPQGAANGAADWTRIVDRDGNWLMDGDVTLIGEGGLVELDELAILTGALLPVIYAELVE